MEKGDFSIEQLVTSTGAPIGTNWETVQDWQKNEKLFWSWLAKSPVKEHSSINTVWQQFIRDPLDNVTRLVETLKSLSPSASDFGRQFSKLQQIIKSYQDRRLSSAGAEAQFINNLKADSANGPLMAAAATGMLVGQVLDLNQPSLLRGAFRFLLFLDGVAPQTNTALKDALQNSQREWEVIAQNRIENLKAIEAEARSKITLAEQQGEELRAHLASTIKQQLSELQADSAKAIESINSTQRAYVEQMRLRASVEYWRKEAEKHDNRFQRAWINLRHFLMPGSIIIAALYVALIKIALNADSHNTVLHVVVAAAAFAIATTAIWTGRILVRIFLSERHMQTDAEERTTMVETYLALTNEGKITDAERALILAALFRNMSDGIVRDDAQPEWTLSTVAANIIAGKRL